MQHLDLLVNLLTLLSGLITAVLGFLLYLKYRINEIKYYAAFILTTTFTVTITTLHSYFANVNILTPDSLVFAAAFVVFEIFIFLINFSFTFFPLGPTPFFPTLLFPFFATSKFSILTITLVYLSPTTGTKFLPLYKSHYCFLFFIEIFIKLFISSLKYIFVWHII